MSLTASIMIALMIAICLLFFQGALAGPVDGTTSTVQPSPTEITDAFCEVNNCTNNYSYCYVYSATGEQYCAPSCKLNNGGCGAMECVMVVALCIRDPCPPVVECQRPRTSSFSITPTPTPPSCPISGQYYSVGDCVPVDATCDNLDPPILCDASLCVCPRRQVISPDRSRCINVTECRNSTVRPSPTGITDAFCEVNNCTNNYSYCYVHSATGEQYCAPSCKLNNGGCGALECMMVDVQCIRDPCPPAVECRQPRTTSYSITPTPTPSCPIRGQYYSSGGCLPVGATCDDPNPPLLCDAFTCVCPDGQVISPDANRCIDVAECPVCPARGQTYITGEYCHPHNATCDNPSPELLCNVSRCECLFGQVLNQETNQCVDAATCVRCPIRGQYYSIGGCHAVDATCDNRNPPFLCDASLCVCPDGQVVSPDGSRCINVTDCRTTVRPSPSTGITDPPCQVNNNCGENSFCYIYPETGEQYCAQSCLLNNGGCGDQQCTMLQVTCFRAPCPPIVQCEPLKSSSTGATRTSSVQPTATPSIDICRLQPESGLCLAYFPSFFYNSSSQMCEKFVYGGCGGNENRFRTIEDCQAACGRSINICELDPETGPCEAFIPSFFYNATSQRCERFVYGGCQGNRNRFSTTTECQRACATDICGLQAEPGNCRAFIPSYFYNAATGECEMFIYGGCGGNRNRFSDIDSCRRTCSASTTPTPVLPKRNVIVITVSFTGDDLEAMVTDFAAELTTVLVNNGYEDAAIRVIDISYDDKDDVVLSVAVYSREDIVDGATIAALINDNRDNFDTSVSGAVVETSGDSDDSDGISSGAIAGVVVGCVIGLIVVLLAAVMVLYYVRKQSGSTSKYAMNGSEGFNNPVYIDHKQ